MIEALLSALAALLLGFGIGWLVARRRYRRRRKRAAVATAVQRDYLLGLSYLIEDQQDKAVELFTKLVEVDQDTIETHLALGKLFRRKGEVERALRVHQNIVARPELARQYRERALLELANDYHSAGMLDRAESVLLDLAQESGLVVDALRALLPIYEQQHDWDRAIQVMKRLQTGRSAKTSRRIAHYYCELALQATRKQENTLARQCLKQAQQADKSNMRIDLLQAELDMKAREWSSAIKSFRRIAAQRPELLADRLPAVRKCFEEAGKAASLESFLTEATHADSSAALPLAYAVSLSEQGQAARAVEILHSRLRKAPSSRLVMGMLQVAATTDSAVLTTELLQELVGIGLSFSSSNFFQCQECGFGSQRLHWNCPSCKSWDSQKPLVQV